LTPAARYPDEGEIVFSVKFFRTAAGNEPVREWLQSLLPEERRVIGFDLRLVQIGFPVGMPLCRPLRDGIYEVRSSLPTKKEARIIFFQNGNELIIIAGFIKKTAKTPLDQIDLAISRKRTFEGG
jgi:phage-related protein